MPISKGKPYEYVSLIYNNLMLQVDYDDWAEYIYKLVKNYISADSDVLDLGAGNCNLANRLIRLYPKLIATDISLSMLTYGDTAAIPKVCCDMTKLPFRKKFHLIYSAFDSVNYLIKISSLKTLFVEVKNLLSDNGIFTFDVCLENNSKPMVKQNTTEAKYGDIRYKQVSSYNRVTKIHKNSFTIYNPTGEIVKEIHKQKIFNFNTYFKIIYDTGLTVINCFDAFTFNDGSDQSERIQFILKKQSS